MKISPLAQGTGVPAQSDSSLGQTASPTKLQRAKAIAAGQEPPVSSGDTQVDRTQASIKKIKMRTQVSTNRDDTGVEAVAAEAPIADEGASLTPVEPAQVAEETKPLSPQFAALAKTKRALQVKERELAQREEALKAQSPAGNEDLIAKLKANPLGMLLENGVSYDDLTQAILANQAAPLDSKTIDSLVEKKLNERLEKEFGTRDQQSEQQVLADIKRETMALTSQGDEFEAIREAKAQQDVVTLIHRTFKETGEVLDTREAAQLVEEQLIDEALPFARIKKVQARLTPQQEAQVVAQIAQPKPGTKIMRTLTNRDSVSPIMDRRARAIAAMNGTLKKG